MFFETGKCDVSQMSPLSLAFIGDTVFDLLARGELVGGENRQIGDLHKRACTMVCAAAQAKAAEQILPLLTEEESDCFRRGRNASPSGRPKNQTSRDYHYATGLECLFGMLYITGKYERIKELYEIIRRGRDEETR